MFVQNLITALIGLVGALVGASATLAGQRWTFRRERRSQIKDASFEVAQDYLSKVQGIRTEYQMLDVFHRGLDMSLNADRQMTYADLFFQRGVDAWYSYRNTQAGLESAFPTGKVMKRAAAVHEALDQWVNAVDADHLGIDVVAYDRSYGYPVGLGAKDDRAARLESAVRKYKKALKALAPTVT